MNEFKKSNVALVASGKSKRLDAIRKKAGLAVNAQPQPSNKQYNFVDGLSPQTKEMLMEAGKVIEERLAVILKTYPPGKTKSYFKIKYGLDVAQLKSKAIKEIFTTLKLDETQIKQFRLIEQLDIHGNRVE